VGPNAKIATYHGGGSASLAAYYAITPFDGISAQLTSPPEYTVGCYAHKELPELGTLLKTDEDKPGVRFRAYNEPPSAKDRELVDDITLTKTEFLMMDYFNPKFKELLWYADIEGYFTAEEDSDFEFGLGVYGAANLLVDGKLLIDNTTKQTKGTMFFSCGTVEEKGILSVKKGQTYHLKVEFASAPASKLDRGNNVLFGGGAVRIGGAKIIDADEEVKHAAALAKDVDQVIICAGLNVRPPYSSICRKLLTLDIGRLGNRGCRSREYVITRSHGCCHLRRSGGKPVNSGNYSIRHTCSDAMGFIR